MKIKEVANAKYKLDAYKMANDALIEHVSEPFPAYYNFFIILCGRPGCGKTNLFLNMINKKGCYHKKFDKVYIFSNSLHTITATISLPDDRLIHGIDDLEDIIQKIEHTDDKVLIILDDVVTDIKDSDIMQRLIFNRRHLAGGVSLVIITQVYNKLKPSLRKCCTDLVLFNTSNKRELESIYADFINIDKADFYTIIKHCFAGECHNFIWIDNTDNTYYHNFNKLSIE